MSVEQAVSAIQLGQGMVEETLAFLEGTFGRERAFDVVIDAVARLKMIHLEEEGTLL